jgi:hypothetical protein
MEDDPMIRAGSFESFFTAHAVDLPIAIKGALTLLHANKE